MRRTSDAALVAKELKARLKKELGANVKSARSEIYAGGSSVNIDLVDPRPEMMEAAKRIGDEYVYGHFNGMEDIYEYNGIDNGKPKVSFVFVRAEYSNEVIKAAKDYAEIKGYTEERFGYSYLYKVYSLPEFWDAYERGANGYESMLAAVKANDEAAIAEFKAKAEAGNLIRLV
jgi:hypothetical protein